MFSIMLSCVTEVPVRHGRGGGGSVIAAFFLAHNYVSEQFGNYVEYGISILLYETCVCVCVFAKLDQFLPVRSHFDTKRPVIFFHIPTFPSPTFGPLFAFHCPLFFTKNNNLHAAMF